MRPQLTAVFVLLSLCAVSVSLANNPKSLFPKTPLTDSSARLGVASCSGSTCHSRQDATGTVVRQNEIASWQDQTSTTGAHVRAYRVLFSDRSEAIAARLGIGPAHEASECLSCHSDNVAPSRQTEKFHFDDGIGCESCHGGASDWISSHYAVGGSHAKSVSLGLYALNDPNTRADVCLSCHVGSDAAGQFVTHRIMAAGHPRMSFELDLFTSLQRHHDEDVDYFARKPVSTGAKTWAVGQARMLERQLVLFAQGRLNTDGIFPEPVFFECRSCHVLISDDPSFVADPATNPGRPTAPGQIRFNDAHMIMLIALSEQIAPDMTDRIDGDIRRFHAALSGQGDRTAASDRLIAHARHLNEIASQTEFSKTQTLGLLDQIVEDTITARYTDYVAAEQAVMAVDTLLSSIVAARQVSRSGVNDLRDTVERGYAVVDDINAYDPAALRQVFRELRLELSALQ